MIIVMYMPSAKGPRHTDIITENDNSILHCMTATGWQFGSLHSRFGCVTHRIMQSYDRNLYYNNNN